MSKRMFLNFLSDQLTSRNMYNEIYHIKPFEYHLKYMISKLNQPYSLIVLMPTIFCMYYKYYIEFIILEFAIRHFI